MALVTDWAVVETADGPMRMYMARPEGGTAGPGVLVIQDMYGLTEHTLDVCRRFADEGFVALAPELYYRFPTRAVEYEDPQAANKLRLQLTGDQIADDLFLAFRFLGNRGEVRSGLVGVVGYGTGGRDAFNLATRNSDVVAVVSYYGSIGADEPSPPLAASASLLAPALLFYGEDDDSIPAAEVQRVQDALTKQGKDFEIVTYPAVGHGFFCDASPNTYDAESADDSWTRAVDFLYQYLEG
jgi:carboxymethylenebutenolidase